MGFSHWHGKVVCGLFKPLGMAWWTNNLKCEYLRFTSVMTSATAYPVLKAKHWSNTELSRNLISGLSQSHVYICLFSLRHNFIWTNVDSCLFLFKFAWPWSWLQRVSYAEVLYRYCSLGRKWHSWVRGRDALHTVSSGRKQSKFFIAGNAKLTLIFSIENQGM